MALLRFNVKFALVDEQREEAQPERSGSCPGCGKPVVARCGEIRMWHWAHKAARLCDPWWENETEWHRSWKNKFPLDWQEVIQRDGSRERHIADVKTAGDWVIEFQNSYIKPEERRSREEFYPRLIWIVNGMRRLRDRPQLVKALKEAEMIGDYPPLRKAYTDDCALLRDWTGSRSLVFFDLGEPERLWFLAGSPGGYSAYIAQFPRVEFIASHRRDATYAGGSFEELIVSVFKRIADYEAHRRLNATRFVTVRLPPIRRSFRL